MTVESQVMAQRLAQLSSTDKQRLLARLLREKALRRAAQHGEVASSTYVQDAALDPHIQPAGPASYPGVPAAVLLTGATGFLGAHLLQELYCRTAATIYCLVRARDGHDAQQRLQANFARYFAHTLSPERVRPIVGDLAQPRLGLSPHTYEALARETDALVHNGAQLHHLASYPQLKASNVSSTVAMLQLATTTRPKWIHYVSTLVAAVERDPEGWLLEDFPRRGPGELAGGYAQSKWVSEKLLAEASRRGIGVTIYRPGFISGRADSGVWPAENDHLLRVIKGCLQMGYAPDSDLTLDMAPVDFISAAIVRIALSEPTAGHVFNLSNPHAVPWSTLLSWLGRCGYAAQVVPNAVWRERYLSRIDRENALFPVLPLYLGGDTTDRHAVLLTKLSKVHRDHTAQMLARLQMAFPAIDQALWQRYIHFFQDSGFLQIPSYATG
jgi:thioester reductase-like protein